MVGSNPAVWKVASFLQKHDNMISAQGQNMYREAALISVVASNIIPVVRVSFHPGRLLSSNGALTVI